MNTVNELTEKQLDLKLINKYASLMALGNGYLGIRSCHEEDYDGQKRGMYVAGIYNRLSPNEATEIVNLPDLIGMEIEINGDIFSCHTGQFLSYDRTLNMLTGELTREVVWQNKDGNRFKLLFQRFVSKDDIHLFASKVTVTSLDCNAMIKIKTGINGQCPDNGKQHYQEEKLRLLDNKIMHGVYQTTESKHTIAIATSCIAPSKSETTYFALNNQLLASVTQEIIVDQPFKLDKISAVYTSNDMIREDPASACVSTVQKFLSEGYDNLRDSSTIKWQDFWKQKRVIISSKDESDQLALDFSLYHIESMTPSHDERFSIGANGLTGEEGKGHIYWDTDIFIEPFYLFTETDVAKKLLKYRHLHIKEAKEIASKNGYEGALFPWASAFTGKEESSENVNSRVNKKQSSAGPRHHVVADIAFSVVQYYENTLDESFMMKEGLELLKETARFWISRTIDENNVLMIKNVVGLDEYTDKVDNNAYTNYLALYNVEQALNYMEKYKDADAELAQNANDFIQRLYLPQPNDENIIPQDDTFLNKPELDLTEYKQQLDNKAILQDYTIEEIKKMQILKQADLVMLMYLFPDLFSCEVVKANLEYYEERTIHDSSLSKSIHAIVFARCDDQENAYQFFQEACLIDLGLDPHSSIEGIHASSLGANWLAVIFGFANISMNINRLMINPKLPEKWNKLIFPFLWQGAKLEITISKRSITVTKQSGPPVSLEINGEVFDLTDKIKTSL